MIKQIGFILFLFIILSISGCRQDNSPAPLKFKAYEHNPVLVPGEPGSWDDLLLFCPDIIFEKNVYHLFYSAYNNSGIKAIGLATSADGYHYNKFKYNPILEADKKDFDAYGVAQSKVIKTDTGWVMYFNGMELAGFGIGAAIGIATATALEGPWTKSEQPVLKSGNRGEWDAEFLKLGSVLILADHQYVMYYTGGKDYISQDEFHIGMATSMDGINWKKYNDPVTRQHPFAESDPVFKTGNPGEWDEAIVLAGYISRNSEGFGMYYAGGKKITLTPESRQITSIGYATSPDGIHWHKYPDNPFYRLEDDPYSRHLNYFGMYLENPSLLYKDNFCFMYYDYGYTGSGIGMGTAVISQTESGTDNLP